jgi:hypothetical protein
MGPVDNPIWTALYHDLELKDDSFAPKIVMKIMAEKPKDITPEEARLKEIAVLQQRDVVLQQRDAVLQRLAVLYGEEAERDPSTASSVSINPAASSGLANLPLTDAILEYLKTCKGPKAPNQIWAALEAAGFETVSETPIDSVVWALKKLAKKNPNVVKVGWGQWDWKSKYTKAKLAKLLAKRAGRGGRSTEEHKKRTLDGMEAAKKRGTHIGAPEKMTPEVMDKIEQMLLAQRKVTDIAAELDVSRASIYARFTVGRRDGKQTVERRDTASSPPLTLVK